MIIFRVVLYLSSCLIRLKHTYGCYLDAYIKNRKYFLKLDGYYFCKKRNTYMAIIRVRNKRSTDELPIQEIIRDRAYLDELHPVDACILGIIANNERNGLISESHSGRHNMQRSKGYNCLNKSTAILEVVKKYSSDKNDMVELYSKILNKEISIHKIDLCKNHDLLYALGSLEALSIGFDTSEHFVSNYF